MSLHHLANHLQSAGRGEDKVLIHMTPGEVHGLQKLAKAHGGSLTINPQTGLPEAGFLSAILPMVAGLALGPAGVGMTALNAGLTVGAVGTLATGSLGKGLMAGFGAYGGAGLGQSLMTAGQAAMPGVTATGETAMNLGAQGSAFSPTGAALQPSNFGAASTAADATTKAVEAGGLGGLKPYAGFGTYQPPAPYGAIDTAAGQGMRLTPGDLISAPKNGPFGLQPESFTPAELDRALAARGMSETSAALQAPGRGYGVTMSPIEYPAIATQSPLSEVAAQSVNTATPVNDINAIMGQGTPPSNYDLMKAGFKDVTSSGTKAWDFVKANPMPFISTGLAAAEALKPKYEPPAVDKGMIRPYTLSRTQNYPQGGGAPVYGQPFDSSERQYFTDQYIAGTPYKAPGPEYAAEGGLMATRYAVGGPVEQMSADNSISANQMYPQSQLQTSIYSNPMVQRPQANNVISPSGDAGVNPYSGEARFADGGETTGGYKYDYNPQTMQFTQLSAPKPVNTGVIGLATRAFTGMYGQPQQTGGNGFNGMLNRAAGKPPQPAAPAAPIVSGGIAPPAYQAQTQQPQMQQPMDIPAYQSPEQQLGLGGFYDYMNQQMGQQGGYQSYAAGGMTEGHLGGYSDGGRLLKGPGDGVSDSIPAVIGNRQPARLADGEFVVPARIVSELGNGSTDAGAKQLYAMMDRVQKARGKTTGKGKVAVNSKANKHLPA